MHTRNKLILLVGMAVSLSQTGCTTDDAPWEYLIIGNDPDDFVRRGGTALYEIQDGMITGTAVANTENSFLCTRSEFGNFILEFKVLADTAVNSGIQIRSHAYTNGRVHGYQVEVDDDPARGWSGGIYDEARRKWLNDLTENDAGRKAFKPGEWNHYRIEAIGNSIKTRVNGIMCASLVDEADTSGFIAFQVHSVNVMREPWTEGAKIKWKDIRLITVNPEEWRTDEPDPVPPKVILLTNKLTDREKDEGWELLFDGTDTGKWRGAYQKSFPAAGWKAENGLLNLYAQGGGESSKAGDIVTVEEFTDFELRLDFMLSPGANSGIKYYVTEKEETEGSADGLEYQLLDDVLHPDAENGRDGNRTLASLYDLIPAAESKYVREPGMWNMAGIISRRGHVEHWLNGSKVLEYERGSDEFRELVANSKFRDRNNYGESESGHILLQEHGHDVAFRNIKIIRN